jgi:hypothetical protein
MKKAFLLICVLAIALGITYLILHKSSALANKDEKKDAPLQINSKSSAFNRSFAAVLESYYQLSAAFVSGDTGQISRSAQSLKLTIDSIRFDQFRADTLVVQTAKSLAQSIPGEIAGLRGEKSLEGKKREFNMITQELYSLIQTTRYDGGTIYYMSCGTAFGESGEGFWLSATYKIVNPYVGGSNSIHDTSKSECGEVKDSLHYSAAVSE